MPQIRKTSYIFSIETHTPKREFYKKIIGCFQPLQYALCRQQSFQFLIIFQKSLEMPASQGPEKVTPYESIPFVHFKRSEHSIPFLSTPVLLFTLISLQDHKTTLKALSVGHKEIT